MADNHGHHNHSHSPPNYNRAFVIGTTLNAGFVIVEAVFGFLTNSLALIADAGHNFSDVLGLLLAWGASWLVRRRPTPRYTYGLRRSSIYAALLNASFLLVAMGAIAWEAIQRFFDPSPISGSTVIGVAFVGIVINSITALMFMSGREGDLNIKGAFLHMAADALVSLGVVLTGIAILTTGWLWFDPVVSLIIVVVIVAGTWNLLRASVNLALDAVPEGIEPSAVRTYLEELPGVIEVHDLHIWAMSTTETALTAHLVMVTGNPGDAFLSRISMELHNQFGIKHTTIQVEMGNFLQGCDQKSCCN
ncbi:MAG: cation diffusion facilitator family transporter [Coleofasciculus sp. S288]|nr:cation diffusion facilitator family transporter [Coleofasciculus sp. S288]